jgi:hypothetical protein
MKAQMTMIQSLDHHGECLDGLPDHVCTCDRWLDYRPCPSVRSARANLAALRAVTVGMRFRVVRVGETAFDRVAGGYLPAWMTT